MTRPQPVLQSARKWIALVVIGHFLAAFLLAASPVWHREVHHDAEDSHHECAVTEIVQGSLDHFVVGFFSLPRPVMQGIPCIPQYRGIGPLVQCAGAVLGRAPPAVG
jgi:hypothetical protein